MSLPANLLASLIAQVNTKATPQQQTDNTTLQLGSYPTEFNQITDEVTTKAATLAQLVYGGLLDFGQTPYSEVILADGPVGYWRLNETSGTTAYDSSGHGNNAGYSGGVTLGAIGPLASGPSAADLDGSSGQAALPNMALAAGDLTIEGWAYDAGMPSGGGGVIGVWITGWAGAFDIEMGDGSVRFEAHNDNAGLDSVQSIAGSFLGEWHHFALTLAAGIPRGYIDGAFVWTGSNVNGALGSTYSGVLGSWDRHFAGALAECALYTYALSSEQLARHYTAASWTRATLSGTGTSKAPGSMTLGQYADAVLADSPSAYWRLNETSGTTANDTSGYGHPGTISGTVTLGAAGPGANGDAAMDFGGGDIATGLSFTATAWTVEFWFADSDTGGQEIIDAGSPTGASTGFEVGFWNNSANCILGTGTGWWQVSPGVPLDGAWHHYAATYDGTTLTVYIDGAVAGSGTNAYAPSTTTVTLANGNGRGAMSGSLSQVAFYTAALTAARISAHYALGRQSFAASGTAQTPTLDLTAAAAVAGASLTAFVNDDSTGGVDYSAIVLEDGAAAYWRLNEATGTTAADSTGSGNAGTYTGGYTLNEMGALADGDAAVKFDGASGYVGVVGPVLAVASDQTLTVEGWVNLDGTTSENGSAVQSNPGTIVESNEGGGAAGFCLAINASNKVWWWPSGSNDRYSSGTISANTWHHIVVALTGGDVLIYIDGRLDSTQANIGQAAGSFLRLAHQSWVGGWLCGTLDEVAVYPVALTAAQVWRHYDAGRRMAKYQARFSPDGSTWGAWESFVNGGELTPERYAQVLATLATTQTDVTPQVNGLRFAVATPAQWSAGEWQ